MFTAGEVATMLHGDFSPVGFALYDGANKKSAAVTKQTEAAIAASSARSSSATARMGASAVATAGLYQDSAGRWRNASGQFASTAEKNAAGVERAHNRMGKAMATAGKVGAAGLAAGVLAAGIVIAKSVSLAADFEQQLDAVGAAAKANAGEMVALKKSAMEAGAATKFSALDAARAEEELAKGGLSVEKIVGGGLSAALALAATDNIDLADAATTVVNAMKQFNLDGDQAIHVADALATASLSGTADVGDFAMALTQGGAAAKTIGMSLNETVALLEVFADNSVKGSDAGTSMKTMLTQLAAPTVKQKDAAKALNLELWDQHNRLKPLPAVARELDQAFGGLSHKQQLAAAKTLAGTDGMRGLLALYASSPAKINAYLAGLEQEGTASDVAAKKQNNLRGKIENLMGSLETAGIALGTGLLPGLTEGAEKLTDTVNGMDPAKLEQFGADIGDVVSAVVEAGPAIATGMKAGMSAFGVAVKGGEIVLLGLLGPLAAILEAVTLAADAFNAITPGKDIIDTDALAGQRDKVRNLMESIHKDLTGGGEVKVKVSADATAAIGVLNRLQGVELKQKVMRVLGSTDDAEGKVKRLAALGIPTKDAKVLAKVSDALTGVSTVRGALAALKDKDVKVSANAQRAIAALHSVQGMDLRTKVLSIVGKDISASAKVKQIRALGIPAKTAQILANNAQALGAIGAVRNQLLGVNDRTVTLTMITRNVTVGAIKGAVGKRAAGKAPGGAERSWVAEGRSGFPELVAREDGTLVWVTQPTVMDLGAGDAVIPSDPQYAGRALGLMFGMLGLPGYAKGKAPSKKKPAGPLPIPDAVRYGAVPEDELGKQRDDAREAYQKRKDRVHDLDVDIRAQRAKVRDAKGPAKKKARAKLAELQRDRKRYASGGAGVPSSLADLRTQWGELKRQFSALHATNLEIERLNKLQENDRTKMATASKRGDETGWRTARDHRGGILSTLRDMYARAVRLAKPDSTFRAELEGQLASIEGEIADAGSDAFSVDETPAQQAARDAAERLADTGMTDPERQRLADLQAQQALAALTTPLDDDLAAAQGVAGFLEQILGAVQTDPARGGSAAVRDIAEQLRQARDNVASFTGGGAANDNADLQAQLDQAHAQTAAAQEESRINAAALSTLEGWGGGGMDRSAGPQITIQTLHPGDAQTLAAIADAATAGQGAQASRTTPRTKYGL